MLVVVDGFACTAAATAAIPEDDDKLIWGCFIVVVTGCVRRCDFVVVSEVGIFPPAHPIAIVAELFFVDV